MPGFTASLTFAVTSSIFCSDISSSSGGPFSSPLRFAREEALAREVALGRAHLVQQVERHVMIGQHQAVGRHERSGSAREAHRRLLHALDPLIGEIDAELLLDRGLGNAIERPEALVGVADERQSDDRARTASERGDTAVSSLDYTA